MSKETTDLSEKNLKPPKIPFRNHPVLKRLASVKIGVVCLLLLFILTLLGTLYQTDNGLYAAQQRFFTSYYLFLGGWLPFPGAKMVLWVFFFNLFAAALRYPLKWEKMGILLIHYGILFLLVSSFITHHYAQESVIALEEGESVNVSRDYFYSELALMEIDSVGEGKNGERREVRRTKAYDAREIEENPNQPIRFLLDESGTKVVELRPIYYYSHSFPVEFNTPGVENASGFTTLSFQPPPSQREAITPGGLFEVRASGWPQPRQILLWEGDEKPFAISVEGKEYFLRIQRKGYTLPFEIELDKFIKEQHLGTGISKSFESDVFIKMENQNTKELVERKTKIFMNNPLRTDGYTLFQASFSLDNAGNRKSIFATVENQTYFIPYVASGLVGLGIILHFIVMFQKRKKKLLDIAESNKQ